MVSCAAFAQPRTVMIITPVARHVYSADPRKAGPRLDDEPFSEKRAQQGLNWSGMSITETKPGAGVNLTLRAGGRLHCPI